MKAYDHPALMTQSFDTPDLRRRGQATHPGAMRTAYLASPYGFADSTRQWYEQTLLPLVRAHVEVIDPWSVEPGDIADPRERWLDLGDRHLDAISERADLVVACLDQEPPDNGTVVELAWAAARGLPVIAYRGDVRVECSRFSGQLVRLPVRLRV